MAWLRGWDGISVARWPCRSSAFTNRTSSLHLQPTPSSSPLHTPFRFRFVLGGSPCQYSKTGGNPCKFFFCGGSHFISTLPHSNATLVPSCSTSYFLSFPSLPCSQTKSESSHIYSLPFLTFFPSTVTSDLLIMILTFLFRPHHISFLFSPHFRSHQLKFIIFEPPKLHISPYTKPPIRGLRTSRSRIPTPGPSKTFHVLIQ